MHIQTEFVFINYIEVQPKLYTICLQVYIYIYICSISVGRYSIPMHCVSQPMLYMLHDATRAAVVELVKLVYNVQGRKCSRKATQCLWKWVTQHRVVTLVTCCYFICWYYFNLLKPDLHEYTPDYVSYPFRLAAEQQPIQTDLCSWPPTASQREVSIEPPPHKLKEQ